MAPELRQDQTKIAVRLGKPWPQMDHFLKLAQRLQQPPLIALGNAE